MIYDVRIRLVVRGGPLEATLAISKELINRIEYKAGDAEYDFEVADCETKKVLQ